MLRPTCNLPVDNALGDWRSALDPSNILQACREQLERVDLHERQGWRRCRMIEALYHPQCYIRAAYVLLSDETVPENRQWPQGQIVYIHAPVRQPMSARGTIMTLDGKRTEAYRFPNDRRLRGLRQFAGRDAALRMWQQWADRLKTSYDIQPDTLQRQLIRYVPEQKWVVRMRASATMRASGTVQKRRVVVRCAAPQVCNALWQAHTQLAKWCKETAVPVKIPSVIGCDADLGLLAVAWARGESLLDTLKGRAVDAVMESVADALASFHAAPADGMALLTRAHVVQRGRDAADDMAAADPRSADRWRRVARDFESLAAELAAVEPVTLHNDFHWNQLRINDRRVAVLDLERMCVGDPLIDVANFATQIHMLGRRPQADVSADTADEWSRAFLEAWTRRSGETPDTRRFRAYTVLSLLELARGMMRHLRAEWPALAERCLEAAELQLAATGREVGVR